MSRFSWWMLHEAKWYIFSFLTDFFFLLSSIDCRLWYYFCMFKFVTQNYVIFNVFLKIFFCFLSRYCLSVNDLLCMQHIPLSRSCRSGRHLHDLHLSLLTCFFFFLLKFALKRKCEMQKHFFFQNVKGKFQNRKGSKKKINKTNTCKYASHAINHVSILKFYFSCLYWNNHSEFWYIFFYKYKKEK